MEQTMSVDGLTASGIIKPLVDGLIEYWVLFVGFITGAIGGLKYLSNRSKQAQKNNDLLAKILESSESMDTTVKEMLEKFTIMKEEVISLRKDYDHLTDKHNDLKRKVDYIERGKL